MDHFRLTNDIYRLLDEKYGIVENASEFMEFLPQGFVNYMTGCINDTNNRNEFAYLDNAMEAFRKADEFAEGQSEPKVDMANLAMLQCEYRKAYDLSMQAEEQDSSYFPALAVNGELAYQYYRAAVDNGIIDSFANYKIACIGDI